MTSRKKRGVSRCVLIQVVISVTYWMQHDRLSLERRMEAHGPGTVKTSDIAHLMELFQVNNLYLRCSHCIANICSPKSSLLRYWQFEPPMNERSDSEKTKVDSSAERVVSSSEPQPGITRTVDEKEGKPCKPLKKVPVFFIDEAHKLYVLYFSY